MRANGYASDLTDDQWRLISDLLPKPKPGGRPRSTNTREVVDAILYLVRTGCQWRQLPLDFPPWRTVYGYFVDWQESGVIRKIHQTLYSLTRFAEGREAKPTAVCIDSQSVKTSKAGGPKGFDGGKRVKGRKRHVVTDTLGLLIDVAVTPANVHDTEGGRRVLAKVKGWIGRSAKRIYADGTYYGAPFQRWVRSKFGAAVEIGKNLAQKVKHFVPSKKRWVIERTFAWFSNYRRLDKDHERIMLRSTAMIRLAMISLMLQRLLPRS